MQIIRNRNGVNTQFIFSQSLPQLRPLTLQKVWKTINRCGCLQGMLYVQVNRSIFFTWVNMSVFVGGISQKEAPISPVIQKMGEILL
jgi:hypothetical protein